MRRPKAPVSKFVTTPHNYAGGKARLLHKIIPEFGDLHDATFIDLFAGGLNVGLNVDARRVVFNDAHADAVSIARYLSSSTAGQVECEVEQIIADYGLSDSMLNGYPFYGTDSSRGLAHANREQFLRLRADINAGVFFEPRARQAAEFTLVLYSFNCYLQRSNATGAWTSPVGKRDFNAAVRGRLSRTVDRLSDIDHEILNLDFERVNPSRYDRPFFYLDPPYALGSAPYNAGWDTDDDRRMMRYLDRLADEGVPWAMSNVLKLKGQENTLLAEWGEQRYTVVHLDFDYANSSHRRRNKVESDTDEVLILSRQP